MYIKLLCCHILPIYLSKAVILLATGFAQVEGLSEGLGDLALLVDRVLHLVEEVDEGRDGGDEPLGRTVTTVNPITSSPWSKLKTGVSPLG